MEALILSCGTGGGHNAAGAAVLEELLRRGHSAQMLDPYSIKSDRLTSTVNNTYIHMAQKVPNAFGAVYHIGNLYRKLPFRSPVYYLNARMVSAMEEFLTRQRFDAVFMPHLFPAEILTNMKRRGIAVPKMFFIATDYTCIPFTEETECDCYITPSKELSDEFCSRGLPRDRLYPLGIPVRGAFSAPLTQAQAKQALGLEADRRYILVSGGSMGAGHLRSAVTLLLEHFGGSGAGVIAICGNNRALYQQLQEAQPEGLIPVGQTSRMAEYMRACDLVITKPGGLSSTEAAVSGSALIHITPIPGCETSNMQFFETRGMAAAVGSLAGELIPACERLLRPGEREAMIQRQRMFINPHAAADICDLAERII